LARLATKTFENRVFLRIWLIRVKRFVYPQDEASEEICFAGEQISREGKQITFPERITSAIFSTAWRDVTVTNQWQSNPILFPIHAMPRD
jgi:hypothetical protein